MLVRRAAPLSLCLVWLCRRNWCGREEMVMEREKCGQEWGLLERSPCTFQMGHLPKWRWSMD